jgi:ABC-type nitrate/sulfonate/bicarbonate transport system permease component
VSGFVFLAVLAALWELAGRGGWVHRLFFPPLSKILAALWASVISGEILSHVGVSLWRGALGYALAGVAAITLGVLMGYWRRAYEAGEILVEFLRAVPAPAIVPVAMVLFGIGDGMKVFVIFLACSFPILINTIDGVRGVDPVLIRTARTFGYSGAAILSKVVLPAASPFIMTGLRIALAISLILVVVSEMVGATSGIGYYILEAQRTFKVPRMYAGMLVLALLGFGLNRCFLLVDARLMAWHRRLTVG